MTEMQRRQELSQTFCASLGALVVAYLIYAFVLLLGVLFGE